MFLLVFLKFKNIFQSHHGIFVSNCAFIYLNNKIVTPEFPLNRESFYATSSREKLFFLFFRIILQVVEKPSFREMAVNYVVSETPVYWANYFFISAFLRLFFNSKLLLFYLKLIAQVALTLNHELHPNASALIRPVYNCHFRLSSYCHIKPFVM